MSTTRIPGPVANQLREGLTLKMGDAASELETASLGDRSNRSLALFAPYFERIDAYRDVMEVLGYENAPDPHDVEIDLDAHRETVDAGLDEAASVLASFAKEGSPDARRQAAAELRELEDFKASLPAAA